MGLNHDKRENTNIIIRVILKKNEIVDKFYVEKVFLSFNVLNSIRIFEDEFFTLNLLTSALKTFTIKKIGEKLIYMD